MTQPLSTPPPTAHPDQDAKKGAVEGDRPTDKQHSNPQGKGIDENGMPNDPVASARDREGANVDKQGGYLGLVSQVGPGRAGRAIELNCRRRPSR